MKKTQFEEIEYFYLKYIHEMNKVKAFLRDAIEIKKHIENLESGNLIKNNLISTGTKVGPVETIPISGV